MIEGIKAGTSKSGLQRNAAAEISSHQLIAKLGSILINPSSSAP
jgi:hypothetical protein